MNSQSFMLIQGHEPYRLFFNISSSACASRCRYCYVPTGRSQPLAMENLRSAVDELQAHPSFDRGDHGTIVTLGGNTDLFRERDTTDALLAALSLLAPLGNPMQISTKEPVRSDAIQRIVEAVGIGRDRGIRAVGDPAERDRRTLINNVNRRKHCRSRTTAVTQVGLIDAVQEEIGVILVAGKVVIHVRVTAENEAAPLTRSW